MKIKKLKVYNDNPDSGVDNTYPTSKDTFKQPCLQMIVGQRTAGKSYLCSKIISQYQKEKTFDILYMVSPSFNSNKSYFGKYIKEENVFEPTKEAITQVIERVEKDRDEWEVYLEKMELYKDYLRLSKNKRPLTELEPELLLMFDELGFMDKEKPKWKYEKSNGGKITPPRSLLILDDCLGAPALLQSGGLTRIATLNRHVAPLTEDYDNRTACGLAVIILSQTYKMRDGISRVLRENLSLLTIFKNKQEKQVEAIKEELANVVDVELFDKAYEYATREKYGSLTVDFTPKDPTKTFRKNLNEVIIFDEIK